MTTSSPSPRQSDARADSAVVLVHGLASARFILAPLANQLRNHGFGRVINWSYPSVLRTIGDHGECLRQQLESLSEDNSFRRIHLVTHSMGGILARHALADRPRIDKLTRIVMLCPPNGGSRVAANLSKVAGWLCQPLRQLSDSPNSYVNTLSPQLPYELGIVAAKRDRVVAVDRTELPSQADHVVLPSGHTSILFTRELWRCVDRFLTDGRFKQPSCSLSETDPRDHSDTAIQDA